MLKLLLHKYSLLGNDISTSIAVAIYPGTELFFTHAPFKSEYL